LRPIAAGEQIARDALGFKRPATGIAPRRLAEVVGREARVDVPADVPLREDMIVW
jgi:sialic acid synthase SpsE